MRDTHIIFRAGLNSDAQRLTRVPYVWLWVAGPEPNVFQWHGMVLVQVFCFIVMHSDRVVMLFAYLERLGGKPQSLGWRFGTLGLCGARWYA